MDEVIAEELATQLQINETAPAEFAAEQDEMAEMFKSMKKKKSKKKAAAAEAGEEESAGAANEALIAENDKQYEMNPDLAGEKKKFSIVPPNVQREGTKKSMFGNIAEISARMNRPMEHVIQYLFCELGTTGSTDANQRLIIKGRFQQKQVETVLKHYIIEYVTCKTCKSPNTSLTKENRLSFMVCESCGSTRSVAPIKTGFKAQTEKRSKMRAKEA